MTLRDGETYLRLAPKLLEAGCGWARAEIELDLGRDEPLRWAERLADLSEEGAGAATIRSYSGQFQATFAMAKKDELHVSVILQDAPDYLNEFRLFLNLPQSSLLAIIDALPSIFST